MRSVQIEVSDVKAAHEIGRLLRSDGWEAHEGVADEAVAAWATPPVLVCDADAATSQANGSSARRMVVVAETAEEALRTALRVGAREAIAWPGERKLLFAAVESASRPSARDESARTCIGVASVRSCGATTLVAHLAGAMTRKGRDVVAIDADLAYADLTGLLVEGEAEPSAADAAKAGLRPESAAVDSRGIRVVAATPQAGASTCTTSAVVRWASEAPGPSDAIRLIDIPSAALVGMLSGNDDDGERRDRALGSLDILVMAVPLDFPGIRRARLLLDIWPGDVSDGLRVLLIQRRRHGISPADALEALGREHLGILPIGGEALCEAIDQGRLLGARPGTPYGRAVDNLAESLASGGGDGRSQALAIGGRAAACARPERRGSLATAVIGLVERSRREAASV